MKKRFLSLILCIAMLFSTDVAGFVALAIDSLPDIPVKPDVWVTLDGEIVDDFSIEQNQKVELLANISGIEVPKYQWQILMDAKKEIWVDIYDKTTQKCEVSYALLKGMLDGASVAYLRCAAFGSDGMKYYSDAIAVTVFVANPDLGIETLPPEESLSEEDLIKYYIENGMFSLLADDVSEYCTITIKYLDIKSLESGIESAIYSPYIAKVEKGTPFNQNVISPTFLGFAPYFDTDGNGEIEPDAGDADGSVVIFNETAVNEDIVINLYYKPINVPFAAKYFFQNINDDLYTENVSLYHISNAETGTIIQDELLKSWAGKTEGFEMMYHIPEAVAADGSTVFECYYDRLYYLLHFDNNGGYGVDPIYARYGTPFIVNDPIRYGYAFGGWDKLTADENGDGVPDKGDGIADSLPSTIQATPNGPDGKPTETYYKAIWNTISTTYTIVYWKENANDNGYSYWGHAEKQALSGSSVSANGTTIGNATNDGMDDASHFAYNDVLSDKDVTVNGDGTTVLNVYYTRNRYTITFVAPGTCIIPVNHVHSEENGCYTYICNSEVHIHDENCELICTDEEHEHSSACCTIPPHDHDETCCILEEHVHTDSCCTVPPHTHDDGCCAFDEHTHTTTCYTQTNLTPISDAQNNIRTAFEDFVDQVTPTNGYIYKYRPARNTYYNYFYLNGDWYYLGANNQYSNVTRNGNLQNPNANGRYNSVPALVNAQLCNKTEHSHDSGNCNYDDCDLEHDHTGNDCVCSEGKVAHTHGESCVCGQTEHEHDDVSCACAKDEHTHTSTCYDCGANAHTHTDACLLLTCPIPTGHSHSGSCNDARQNSTVKLVTRKYEQNIHDVWVHDENGTEEFGVIDDHGVIYNNGERWKPTNLPGVTEVLVYIAIMPAANFTLTYNTSDSTTKTMNYYLEVLPGDAYDKEYNGRYFKLEMSVPANYNHMTEAEDFFDIAGFDKFGSDPAFSQGQITRTRADFYYTRTVSHEIEFNNNGNVIFTETGIPFGDHLHDHKINVNGETMDMYQFVPQYPNNLEPNAYTFAGWYTSPGCFEGTEVDWDNINMQDNDMIFYSKWAPTTHDVKFFLTLDDMNAYLEDNTLEPLYTYSDITHGNIVGSVETPTRVGDGDQPLTFAGWFYIENGQKKAFSPLNMPINGDMTIYADWGSHTPVPYRIQYVLMSDNSVHVAPDSYGHAYAGSTRTFQAKAGPPLNQLYPEYASGYFPTVASHSITMQYESDDINPEKNVYTFFYVQASEISYTINYVNKENNVVMESVVKKTTDSVVTERFKAFDNMVPDAFYKRLVISVVWDEESGQYVGLPEDNVINFYYTPNDTTTFYAVKFMLEKLDQPGEYEESTTHIEGVADIGSTVPITPQEFPGFKLKEAKVNNVTQTLTDGKYNITATKEGTELVIYYDRITVDYTVHYYKYNTTESLATSKTGSAKYGATVTENALSKSGWTCVSATTQSKQISDDAAQNVIIFYYAEVQYVVEYIPVEDDTGWLSSTKEVVMGDDEFSGSIARSNEYYSFEGWFMDEACTIPVPADKATLTSDGDDVNNVLVPVRAGLSETEANKFYAKFSPKAADLTINVTNAADNSQVFVFMIENNATGETLVVTIVGNGTVTISGLTLAEYTVYQLSEEWSWRYVEYNNVIAHASAGGTVVNVGEQLKSNQQWLNGNSDLLHNVKGE